MSKPNFPEIAEMASVIGSITATVPALVYNQVALACVPISLALALNLLNRRQLVAQANQLAQNQQTAIQAELTSFRQQYSDFQTELGQLQLLGSNLSNSQSEVRSQLDKLTEPIAHLQQVTTQYHQEQDNTQEAIAKLEQKQALNFTEMLNFQEQLTVAQKLNGELFQVAQQWEKQYVSWEQEKAAITKQINLSLSTAKSIDVTESPNSEFFYQLGITHSQLQEWGAALDDYTKAIEITPEYAEAYRDRGLAKAELADKKGAIADLRKANQLFFERGDIDSYHQTRDSLKNLHELRFLENSLPIAPETVQSLFGSVI
jgi:tetratricopeptide (TPR) repeat protein